MFQSITRFSTTVFLSWILIATPIAAEERSQEAIDALRSFFDALGVDRYGDGSLEKVVTDDFVIFEMGQEFTLDEFKRFLESANYSEWVSTQWQLSNHSVWADENAAHIHYHLNQSAQLTQQDNFWLESAFFVREEGQLKLKFLQSENVYRKQQLIAEPVPVE
ncbi:hypothetical protein N9W12_05530 [Luminiphilus sp.]|nr:hypothetical protein [Luminiphilus sp.]